MEPLINALIGGVVLVYDVVRGLLEWGGKALLTGLGAGAGSYLGVRYALRGQVPKVRTSVVADPGS